MMNAEVALQSGVVRIAQPVAQPVVEPEWVIEAVELAPELDEEDDLYSNMPCTD